VKEVIQARISRLGDEAQHVLKLASVAGKDFTFETLLAVTDFDEEKLLTLMEKILETGLIVEKVLRGDAFYSFTDIIVKDVIYDQISYLRRRKIHGTVGHALEKIYAEDIDEHLGELASHFQESGNSEKALGFFLRAGERAEKIYANAEAASYLQSAYTLLQRKKGELPVKAVVLEQLGDIKNIVGDYDDCMRFWNQALQLQDQLHKRRNVANLHRKMANVLWEKIGQSEKAESHYRMAQEIMTMEPESIELASIFEDMAHMYYRIGDVPRALSYAENALKLAEKLDSPEVIASSSASLGTIYGFRGEVNKGRDFHERALELALEHGYFETALRVYNNLPGSLPFEDQERRSKYFQSGFELAKKVGHISWQAWMDVALADMWIGKGDVEKALTFAEEAVALDKKTNLFTHLPLSIGTLGLIHLIQGEWDIAESEFREALTAAQKLNDFQSIGWSYGLLGYLQLEKQNFPKAKELFAEVHKGVLNAGVRPGSQSYLPFLTLTYIELGEFAKALEYIDNLHEFGVKKENSGHMLVADLLKASLLRAERKWEKSVKLFEKCFMKLEAISAKQWDAYMFAKYSTQYARVFLERGQEGDHEKARELLDQAFEIFQKLGAKKEIERLELQLSNLATKKGLVTEPDLEWSIIPSQHISTGTEELDKLLLGGLPRNYSVILSSPSCDEKDLLVTKFLDAGIKKDETTFYVTARTSGIESSLTRIQPNFYLFACNPQADKLVEDSPNVIKLKGTENLNAVNIALTSTMHRLNQSQKSPRRVCVEIISDILLQHQVVKTRRWLNALIPELKSNGFTTLAVIDSEIHSQPEVRAVAGVFEGELAVFSKIGDKGQQRFLKISKMANQRYLDDELLLTGKN
jgi:tetratricopeptide (TPR) repeat protein/KaiC/GvpD/RAD55 family RecA-like ATPase